MKRFTQYLYEYQKETRVRNIGFVKVEFAQNSGSIQIQARGLDVSSGGKLSVYLFYPKTGAYESVLQGQIEKRRPLVNYVLEFSEEDMGEARSTEELTGILLQEEGGASYIATWNGKNVNTEEIHRIGTQSFDEDEKDLELPEEAVEDDEVPSTYVCEKIQRKDLARLPRKDWYLANNNFLLHGWYNYHHLLWLEDGENLYIGVPGVCHPRECQVAKVFGFAQFLGAGEIGAGIGRDEPGRDEDFGYFCRRIRKNR